MSIANARCESGNTHNSIELTVPIVVTIPYAQGRQILPRNTQFMRPIKFTVPRILGTQITRHLTGYDPTEGIYFHQETNTYWDKNDGSATSDDLQVRFSEETASRWIPYAHEKPILRDVPQDWSFRCRVSTLDSVAVTRYLDTHPIEIQDLPMQALTRNKRGAWTIIDADAALDAAERVARAALKRLALIDGVLTEMVSEPVVVLRPSRHAYDSTVRPWVEVDWLDRVSPGESYFRLTNDIRKRFGNEYFDAMSVLDENSPAWTAPSVDQVLCDVKKQVQRSRNELISTLEVRSGKEFDHFRAANLFSSFGHRVMEQELLESLTA